VTKTTRRIIALASFVVAGAFGGCDCAGCSKTNVGEVSGKDWSVSVVCESSTRLGGVGAGHVGGILYPDGCDVNWSVSARARDDRRLDEPIDGERTTVHECSKTKAFCKEAKVDTAKWVDGEDVKVAVSAGDKAYVVYILQPGRPLIWPKMAVADDVLAVQAAGDVHRLLDVSPSPDALLTSLLDSDVSIKGGVEEALTGPRLERHLAEVKRAIERCTLSEAAMTVVARSHAETVSDVYSALAWLAASVSWESRLWSVSTTVLAWSTSDWRK